MLFDGDVTVRNDPQMSAEVLSSVPKFKALLGLTGNERGGT